MEKSENMPHQEEPSIEINVSIDQMNSERNAYRMDVMNPNTGRPGIMFGTNPLSSEFQPVPSFGFPQFYQPIQPPSGFFFPHHPPPPPLHDILPQDSQHEDGIGSLATQIPQISLSDTQSPPPVSSQNEIAALQNARRMDAHQMAIKDMEIQKLREELDQLRRWTMSLQQELHHQHFQHQMMLQHQQQQQQQQFEAGHPVEKVDRLANSIAVNSLFASHVKGDDDATIPPGLPVAGQNGNAATSGIVDPVAAAAEETSSLFVPTTVQPEQNVFPRFQNQPLVEPIFQPELPLLSIIPAPLTSTTLPQQDQFMVSSPPTNSTGSTSSLNLSSQQTDALSPPTTSWPNSNPATLQRPKSIWSPLLLHNTTDQPVSNTPEYLNEAKEFVPSTTGVTFSNTTYLESNNSDSSLNHLKSIWEVDESISYDCYDPTIIEDELSLSNKHRSTHKSYRQSSSTPSQPTTFHTLVEKIVRTQDQPASLLLQQKLKTTHPETRNQIIEAILAHSLNLIRNRFGNFLVQRCLEVGDKEQIHALTSSMLGCVVMLSCDRFGCHVVQKALDVCDDSLKVAIIRELLVAIPDTITHRFACHVWQRIFETKWTLHPYSAALTSTTPQNTPLSPQSLSQEFTVTSKIHPVLAILRRMDRILRNQWHQIANDESGSLVVQCIFENCPEPEKRGIIGEVLTHAAEIARGQWGNWVIQHLLDRGYPPDKSHILQVVSTHIHALSIDQFASKVVEKALKTCPKRELYLIVEQVISGQFGETGHPAIIDMMNNQYANYVVQHILTLAEPQQRDTCTRLIAPHLGVLRGSKYGQRVAAIVEKNLRCVSGFRGSMMVPGSSSSSGMVGNSGIHLQQHQQHQQQQHQSNVGIKKIDGNSPIYSQFYTN
ncbi:hypothetical protein HDU79_000249 [Rhizoclosmatium sp. JEL0117]|nr:hypothetical protein HDU79_000249 [Rhizoclosmatium sp. JEL0117]